MTNFIDMNEVQLAEFGLTLAKQDRRITNRDRKEIESHHLVVGKMLAFLRSKLTAEQKQIPTKTLKKFNLASIDRRRRKDAEDLAKSWEHPTMVELVKSKRFSSVTTLIGEFNKLTKDVEPKQPKTAEQLVEELLKAMDKNEVSTNELFEALQLKLFSASNETPQEEVA